MTVVRGGVLFASLLLVVAGCSDSKPTLTTPPSTPESTIAAITESSTIDVPTTEATTTEATTTEAPTTTTTTTSTTSTTEPGPTTSTIAGDGPSDTTLPHGPGVVTALVTGEALPAAVATTAEQLYDASLRHYFGALRPLVAGDGTRRFRTGYTTGEAVERWKKAFANGSDDPLAHIVRLLESTPGRTAEGDIVYPYLAMKDPATWDANDDQAAAALGFSPESIAATKEKGRYLDLRLVFSADGVWRAFAIGG